MINRVAIKKVQNILTDWRNLLISLDLKILESFVLFLWHNLLVSKDLQQCRPGLFDLSSYWVRVYVDSLKKLVSPVSIMVSRWDTQSGGPYISTSFEYSAVKSGSSVLIYTPLSQIATSRNSIELAPEFIGFLTEKEKLYYTIWLLFVKSKV